VNVNSVQCSAVQVCCRVRLMIDWWMSTACSAVQCSAVQVCCRVRLMIDWWMSIACILVKVCFAVGRISIQHARLWLDCERLHWWGFEGYVELPWAVSLAGWTSHRRPTPGSRWLCQLLSSLHLLILSSNTLLQQHLRPLISEKFKQINPRLGYMSACDLVA